MSKNNKQPSFGEVVLGLSALALLFSASLIQSKALSPVSDAAAPYVIKTVESAAGASTYIADSIIASFSSLGDWDDIGNFTAESAALVYKDSIVADLSDFLDRASVPAVAGASSSEKAWSQLPIADKTTVFGDQDSHYSYQKDILGEFSSSVFGYMEKLGNQSYDSYKPKIPFRGCSVASVR